MPLLTVALVPAPDRVVVRLNGETDLSTAPVLTDQLARAAAHGTHAVIVDVSCVCFWDSSGLRALADLTSGLAATGRHCRLVGAHSATRRLIAMADFTAALDLDGPVHLQTAVRRRPAPAPATRARERPAVVPA